MGAHEEVPGAHEVLVVVVRGEEELAQKAGVEGVDHEVSEVVEEESLWVPLEQDGDVVQLGQDAVVGLQDAEAWRILVAVSQLQHVKAWQSLVAVA